MYVTAQMCTSLPRCVPHCSDVYVTGHTIASLLVMRANQRPRYTGHCLRACTTVMPREYGHYSWHVLFSLLCNWGGGCAGSHSPLVKCVHHSRSQAKWGHWPSTVRTSLPNGLSQSLSLSYTDTPSLKISSKFNK